MFSILQLQGLLLVWLAEHCYGMATTTIDCTEQANPSSPFSITCHITGSLTSGITWSRPAGAARQVASCSGPDTTDCITSILGYSVSFANETVNILNIATFSANDEGNWTCVDGTFGSPDCPIVSSAPPNENASSVTFNPSKSLKAGENLTINVHLIRYYCSQSVSFTLSLGGRNITLSNMTASNSQFVNGSDEVTRKVTEDMDGPIKLFMKCEEKSVEVLQGLGNLNIAPCRCLCRCHWKTRDVPLLVLLIVIIVVMLVLNILMIKGVVKNSCSRSASPNNPRNVKQPIIIFIVITLVALVIGITFTIIIAAIPSTQDEAKVPGQECCCSTCEPDGENERNQCEAIGNAVLAFGIILILIAVIAIIVIVILIVTKGMETTSSYLPLCVCYSEPGKTGGNESTERKPGQSGATSNKSAQSNTTQAKPRDKARKETEGSDGKSSPNGNNSETGKTGVNESTELKSGQSEATRNVSAPSNTTHAKPGEKASKETEGSDGKSSPNRNNSNVSISGVKVQADSKEKGKRL